jgi:hypothetical protein
MVYGNIINVSYSEELSFVWFIFSVFDFKSSTDFTILSTLYISTVRVLIYKIQTLKRPMSQTTTSSQLTRAEK